MQLREINIQNFRGIASLCWRPTSPLTCIIGPGDSGKSTLLDAIEAVLSSRWSQFSDVDFPAGDLTKTIQISATVGHLPSEALRESRFGFHLRGWSPSGGVNDEPQEDDEPVVTVRLTVDASLDPVWELVTERNEPRALSQRDRSLFGVVRLGGDAERHLTWGQGSALSRLSAEREQASAVLTQAYRQAKDHICLGGLPALDGVAETVRGEARKLGAYTGKVFTAGLDTQRTVMTLGSLGIHDDGVPLRLSGLGTRRLAALAVQKMSIPNGAIILIDEVEHGLEPHRIRRALKVLRETLGIGDPSKVGQVFLTTHATTSIVELACDQLAICRRNNGSSELRTPSTTLQALVRRAPEAFLSRKVLVCEGKTEVGLLRGLRDYWLVRNDGEPLETLGVIFADGNGGAAVPTAQSFASLGYNTSLLRDSDVPLTEKQSKSLQSLGVTVFEWDGSCSLEQRLFLDLSTEGVCKALELAFSLRGESAVLDAIRTELGSLQGGGSSISEWVLPAWIVPGRSELDVRKAIGKVANEQEWYKYIDPAEKLGLILASDLVGGVKSSIASTLELVEAWTHG